MAKCMYTQHSMQEKSNHTGATRHATKTLNNKILQKNFGHIGKKWYFCTPKKGRRDGRAVDCGGLENR